MGYEFRTLYRSSGLGKKNKDCVNLRQAEKIG